MSHRAASSELVQGFFPQWILRASFIKISTRNEPAGTTARIAGFVKLPVRYVDLPGVKIHPNKIPEPLRDLLPFARQWCFVEEDALYTALDQADTQSIQTFVDNGNSKDEQLYDFCFRQDLPTPVPDEVVLMQTMYHNLEAARSRLALRRTGSNAR